MTKAFQNQRIDESGPIKIWFPLSEILAETDFDYKECSVEILVSTSLRHVRCNLHYEHLANLRIFFNRAKRV